MTKKELMLKAHKMAREIKNEYPAVDYKFQLGLCLAYLYENEGEVEMISYTTKNGAKVEIKLEGKLVTDLTVNGIVVVENNTDSDVVFISTFNNTIVLNSSLAYKKLGGKSVIRIAANDEVIKAFKEATQKSIEEMNKKTKEFVENTKISAEQYNYTFEKHMNDRNA